MGHQPRITSTAPEAIYYLEITVHDSPTYTGPAATAGPYGRYTDLMADARQFIGRPLHDVLSIEGVRRSSLQGDPTALICSFTVEALSAETSPEGDQHEPLWRLPIQDYQLGAGVPVPSHSGGKMIPIAESPITLPAHHTYADLPKRPVGLHLDVAMEPGILEVSAKRGGKYIAVASTDPDETVVTPADDNEISDEDHQYLMEFSFALTCEMGKLGKLTFEREETLAALIAHVDSLASAPAQPLA